MTIYWLVMPLPLKTISITCSKISIKGSILENDVYRVYCATGEVREYTERWEAETILRGLPPGKIPAVLMQNNKVLEIRAKPLPSSGNYMDR